MTVAQPRIEGRWAEILAGEFNADYFQKLKEFLVEERRNYNVYPPGSQIFSAFNLTPFNRVKVVIIGQDPYHGQGQAHGLCFSVPKGIKPPPSLVNIFKELERELAIPMPSHGNLDKWAQQGVFLLNATLTVRENQAGSHQKKGWEQFTDAAIKALSEYRENLIFMLWGNFAQAKISLIDQQKHHVLMAAHPSPFSVERGFFGCNHFARANEILSNLGLREIDWRLD